MEWRFSRFQLKLRINDNHDYELRDGQVSLLRSRGYFRGRIRHYSWNGRQSSCSVKAGSQNCVLLTTEYSLDKGAHWDAGATYEVTLDLIFTRARVLQYLREQFYTLSTSNGGI